MFCTDEHRLGLKPVLRSVWAPKGQRPTALGHHRFEWLYVTAFVGPATGETIWYLSNGVSKPLFAGLLAAFATAVGAGPIMLRCHPACELRLMMPQKERDALFADHDAQESNKGGERRRWRVDAQQGVEGADQDADRERDQEIQAAAPGPCEISDVNAVVGSAIDPGAG